MQQTDKEKRLIKTVLFLLDMVVDEEFGVRPCSAAEWERQQEFRDELIERTFVDKSDLIVSE